MSLTEKDFKYREYKEYCDMESEEELEICEIWTQTIEKLYECSNNLFTNVKDKWEYVWSSDEFQKINLKYCNCVPYSEHIDAMIETYHDKEIEAWEEADKLFPNTRKNMRREFYYEDKEDKEENKIIERDDMNDEEKDWHNYVDKRLEKDRHFFEKTVQENRRRSYVFDEF